MVLLLMAPMVLMVVVVSTTTMVVIDFSGESLLTSEDGHYGLMVCST